MLVTTKKLDDNVGKAKSIFDAWEADFRSYHRKSVVIEHNFKILPSR